MMFGIIWRLAAGGVMYIDDVIAACRWRGTFVLLRLAAGDNICILAACRWCMMQFVSGHPLYVVSGDPLYDVSARMLNQPPRSLFGRMSFIELCFRFRSDQASCLCE